MLACLVVLGTDCAWADDSLAEGTLAKDPFAEQVTPFLAKYCYDCHQGGSAEAGVDLSLPTTLAEAQQQHARWNQIRGVVQLGAMPPADYDPLPSAEEKQAFAKLLDELVNRVDCNGNPGPGRVTMRRLNAAEYDNTLRDLLQLDFKPSEVVGLPSDDVGNGFDNQGEVLSMSPLLMEKYLSAAATITDRALLAKEATAVDVVIAEPSSDVSVRDAATRVFNNFLPRAYRRSVDPIEVQRLADLVVASVERGDSYRQGVALGVQVAIASPYFLFRIESPPESSEPSPVGPYELASRLSYFLGATMPDDELLANAGQNRLGKEAVLREEVRRLMAKPSGDTLVTRFFAQWLGLTALAELSPDPQQFPLWNTKLAKAVEEETLRLCRTVVSEDRSLLDLFDADFTYVNPRLAELYGMKYLGQDPAEMYFHGPGSVENPQSRKWDLATRGEPYQLEDRWVRVPASKGRRGVMTHASVLALTSNPSATSPVKRGQWVLDVVLGDSPPPAPPTVPSLEETAAGAEGKPLREQLAIHRENPSCAGCHKMMDPIGLGLENFDAIGRWRDEDQGQVIDPAGELAGERFSGPEELMSLIRRREDDIARNFVERLMTYALGRGLRPADQCAVDEIVEAAKPSRYPMSALITGVVLSDPFRMHSQPTQADN